MVTFCTGLEPSVSFATSACPASCTAVSHRSLALTWLGLGLGLGLG
jgi:hypothetical protein